MDLFCNYSPFSFLCVVTYPNRSCDPEPSVLSAMFQKILYNPSTMKKILKDGLPVSAPLPTRTSILLPSCFCLSRDHHCAPQSDVSSCRRYVLLLSRVDVEVELELEAEEEI